MCQTRRMHGPLGRPWLSRMQPEWQPYTSPTIRRLRQKRCIVASIMTVLRVSRKRFSWIHFPLYTLYTGYTFLCFS